MILNFKILLKSFWLTFLIVLTPTLVYVPIILLRNNFSFETRIPEWHLVTLILSVFVMLIIDSIVYTAITIVYLLKKGN